MRAGIKAHKTFAKEVTSYPADLRFKVGEMLIPIELHLHLLNSTEIWIYLTIRLRARNFYEVIELNKLRPPCFTSMFYDEKSENVTVVHT